ncbi:UNVERIFIED_CONTAM: hypothetical protein HDU68_007600 [Siphonaria sp. JEL0065]|nr:hypothetical protein HDU68_007600 [Siphonaria sp. JEL0065]
MDARSAGCSTGQPWIGGTFPQGLEQIPSITYMLFDNCQMSGPLPDTFGSFTVLFEMHLQGNNFQGQIPPSFAGMTSMTYFHAQGNKFVGNLPDLSSWTAIKVAEFDGNCLIGSSSNAKISLAGQTGCSNPISPPLPIVQSPVPGGRVSTTTATTTTKTIAPSSAPSTPSSAPSSASTSPDSSGLSVPLIGGIAGGVVFLIILGVAICCCIRNKKKKAQVENDSYRANDYKDRNIDYDDGYGRRQPQQQRSYGNEPVSAADRAPRQGAWQREPQRGYDGRYGAAPPQRQNSRGRDYYGSPQQYNNTQTNYPTRPENGYGGQHNQHDGRRQQNPYESRGGRSVERNERGDARGRSVPRGGY